MTRSNLERMLRESRWTFVLGLLAVSVAVGLYFRAGLFDFCTYDDPGYITMNRHVLAKFSWDSVRTAFSLRQVTYWHPLTTLSFMLDHHFYRLWPGGYHMTNVLLHGVNVALFFALILALRKIALRRFSPRCCLRRIRPMWRPWPGFPRARTCFRPPSV